MAFGIVRGIVVLLTCLGFTAPAWAAEPEEGGRQEEAARTEEAAASKNEKAHAYLSFGLVAANSSFSSPLIGDVDASGGGLGLHGAAHSGKVNPSLDIGFSGQVALMSRTFDDTDVDVADVLYEIDGGLRFSNLFYLTLGYSTQVTAYENPDLVTTYNIVPVGLGVLKTSESGYLLAQLRAGGGRLSNDQNDDTESVGYLGLRAVVQHGFGSGVQFMLGLGLDRYDLGDANQTDDFVRLEAGIGFGI